MNLASVEPTAPGGAEGRVISKNFRRASRASAAIDIFAVANFIIVCVCAAFLTLGIANLYVGLLILPSMGAMLFYFLPIAFEGVIRLFRTQRLIRANYLQNNSSGPALTAENYKEVSDNYVWIYFVLVLHLAAAAGIWVSLLGPGGVNGNNYSAIFLLIASMGPAEISLIFSMLAIVILRAVSGRIAALEGDEQRSLLQKISKRSQIVAVMNILVSGAISLFLVFRLIIDATS